MLFKSLSGGNFQDSGSLADPDRIGDFVPASIINAYICALEVTDDGQGDHCR
jgi:hypothetical protein